MNTLRKKKKNNFNFQAVLFMLPLQQLYFG